MKGGSGWRGWSRCLRCTLGRVRLRVDEVGDASWCLWSCLWRYRSWWCGGQRLEEDHLVLLRRVGVEGNNEEVWRERVNVFESLAGKERDDLHFKDPPPAPFVSEASPYKCFSITSVTIFFMDSPKSFRRLDVFSSRTLQPAHPAAMLITLLLKVPACARLPLLVGSYISMISLLPPNAPKLMPPPSHLPKVMRSG